MGLPATPYMPGFTFLDLGPDGGTYDETKHPKGCLHTTEGTSIAGAESAFRQFPPHLCYDPAADVGHQYVRLDRYAMSLYEGESDDEFVVQVELVGRAAETHTWPDEWYRRIGARVIAPLREIMRIPDHWLRFYRQDEGIVLATPSSPIRLSAQGLRDFSGWFGHQHAPANDSHWDPGGFLVDKAINYSREDQMSATAEQQIAHMTYGVSGKWEGGQGGTAQWDKLSEILNAVHAVSDEIDALAAKVDEIANRPAPEAAAVPQPLQVQLVQDQPSHEENRA